MNCALRAAGLCARAIFFRLFRHVLLLDDAEALLVVIEDLRAEEDALAVALAGFAVDSNLHRVFSLPVRFPRELAT